MPESQIRLGDCKKLLVVTVSKQLKEGQIREIHQHLEKKIQKLHHFKQQLERAKRRLKVDKAGVERRLKTRIKGQFIDQILKYEIIALEGEQLSFTHLDEFRSI